MTGKSTTSRRTTLTKSELREALRDIGRTMRATGVDWSRSRRLRSGRSARGPR